MSTSSHATSPGSNGLAVISFAAGLAVPVAIVLSLAHHVLAAHPPGVPQPSDDP